MPTVNNNKVIITGHARERLEQRYGIVANRDFVDGVHRYFKGVNLDLLLLKKESVRIKISIQGMIIFAVIALTKTNKYKVVTVLPRQSINK